MDDLIRRQAAIDCVNHVRFGMEKMAFDIVTNALLELPSAQPETHEERTEMHACDSISRQAVVDMILGQPPEPHYPSWYAEQIKALPSAQPERKTGKLIYGSAYNWFRCNVCKKIYPSEFMQYFDSCQYQPRFNFCPHCGADMRGEQDE